MRNILIPTILIALVGCAITRPITSDAQRKKAERIGATAGSASCSAAILNDVKAKGPILVALAKTTEVLAAPDFTLAALEQGIAQLPDPKSRAYGGILLSSVMAGLYAGDVDIESVDKDSPLIVGLSAAVAACGKIVGQP
jgi:hypothetical protein